MSVVSELGKFVRVMRKRQGVTQAGLVVLANADSRFIGELKLFMSRIRAKER